MRFIFRGVKIHYPGTSLNNLERDFFIDNGFFKNPEESIPGVTEIDARGLLMAPGFLDFFAHFHEPGNEFKETIKSGSEAALAGGFTTVLTLPNNNPVTDNAAQVEFARNKSAIIDVHPLGAITKNADGKELAEMYDMAANGSPAFTDGVHPVQNEGMLLKAFQYLKAIGSSIIQLPRTIALAPNGLMNEGVISTKNGLPGLPALAEELMIYRDIELLRYTSSKLHITGVSTKKGFDLIRQAKNDSLEITCSIAPYQLVLTDDALSGYDTNLKVYPPLRTVTAREAVFAAIADGTIDGVASHHLPQSWDDKFKEFEYAAEGMLGLQTAFYILNEYIGLEKAIEFLAFKNKAIFSMPVISFIDGEKASFTLIDPNGDFTFTETNNRSKSTNSPFFKKEWKARIAGTFHNGNWWPNA